MWFTEKKFQFWLQISEFIWANIHRHSNWTHTLHFTTFRSCRLWQEWWLRRQIQINAMKIIVAFIRWCISTIKTGSRPVLKREHMICIFFFGIQTHVAVFNMRAHQLRSKISSNEWTEKKKERKKNNNIKFKIRRSLKTNQSKQRVRKSLLLLLSFSFFSPFVGHDIITEWRNFFAWNSNILL